MTAMRWELRALRGRSAGTSCERLRVRRVPGPQTGPGRRSARQGGVRRLAGGASSGDPVPGSGVGHVREDRDAALKAPNAPFFSPRLTPHAHAEVPQRASHRPALASELHEVADRRWRRLLVPCPPHLLDRKVRTTWSRPAFAGFAVPLRGVWWWCESRTATGGTPAGPREEGAARWTGSTGRAACG